MAAFVQDSYTFAKEINGVRKLKTISRLDPDQIGNLNATVPDIGSAIGTTVRTLAQAMAGVVAGTDAYVNDDVGNSKAMKYRVSRQVPVTETL